MSNQPVHWEVKDGVGIVTLNRAEKRNAINGDVLEGIRKAFSELSINLEARVLLLQGAGPVFSAGIDFNFLGKVAQDDGRAAGIRLREDIETIQTILNRIERIEKPVVAKIHGFCGGLGLELALTADFRIASENATLGVPEIILGIIPDCGGTSRLTRMLGPAWAKELIMTGDMIPAKRAYEMGLVNQICPRSRPGRKDPGFLGEAPSAAFLSARLGQAGCGLGYGTGQDDPYGD